ncbi:formylglycine-generating enzyme family protein [Trichlorobacter lovleyi]|uniref:formylglycine-generating enzyme family protein n=1 Tax=Trichlorobacter lovleyi TaxID=313985 RepID=UPI003D0E1B31
MNRTAVYMGAALLAVALATGPAEAAAKKAKKANSNQAAAAKPIASFTNSIGMVFVKVPAGSFTMGTEVNCQKPDAFSTSAAYDNCMASISKDETPARTVTISKDFWIGQFEVTQAQWYAVMGNNPSEFKSDKVGEDSRNFPVENVSWEDVQQFISRLEERDGKKYRLPTEAEWEYACKSGGKDQKYCGGNDVDAVAWHTDNSGKRTHRVGTKRPNGLGIYDMSGNVFEWCNDWYSKTYYQWGRSTDPYGPAEGGYRVIRGGSWDGLAFVVRAAFRESVGSPGDRNNFVGFRLVSP